jgi:putative two-component system response regulator
LFVAVVDDQVASHAGFSQILARIPNIQPMCFDKAVEALHWLGGVDPIFVVVSATMPQVDGIEFIRRFRAMPGRKQTPVLLTGSKIERDARRTAFELDVFAILEKPINPAEFLAHARRIVETHEKLFELQKRIASVDQHTNQAPGATATLTDDAAIEAMRSVAALHHPIILAQMDLAALLAGALAKEMRLTQEEQTMLASAGRIYDIGKVAIPHHILESATKPDAIDRKCIESHADAGSRLLQARGTTTMRMAAIIAQTHHEHFDGTGYPRKLRGSAIPILGRIMAVADAMSSLVSPRADREALSMNGAIEFVEKKIGHAYDPAVIHALRSGMADISRILHEYQTA